MLFPKSEPWLDAYLLELTTFPNAKNDDQVDSTVNALAWMTEEISKPVGFFDMNNPQLDAFIRTTGRFRPIF